MPLTGRYAVQGRQMRAGLELWAKRSSCALELVDDRSDPARAATVHEKLRRHCEIVLGPYGSDSTRAVAEEAGGALVWNHGAAADDVQRMPGVVSLPTPASAYLVALGRAVAGERPAATVVVGRGRGRFCRQADEALLREASSLGLEIVASTGLDDVARVAAVEQPQAVLLCGPLQPEAAVLAQLEREAPGIVLGGVSPGVADFATVAGTELNRAFAPVQWHPDAVADTRLGPTITDLLADASASHVGELDYVAVQAYAAALIADACAHEKPSNPRAAALQLRTRTVYGDFGVDPDTGLQRAHRLSVIRREHGRRLLHLANAA